MLSHQDEADTNTGVKPLGETPKGLPTDPANPVSTEDIVKMNQESNKIGTASTTPVTNNGMTPYEEEQINLLRQMSIREEEERKKIEDEEEKILKQVMELSCKEHEQEEKREENKKKEEDMKELNTKEEIIKKKEKKLKEKEKKLKREEERIRKEKKKLEKQKLKEKKELDKLKVEREDEQKVQQPSEVQPTQIPETVVAPVIVKKKKKKVIKEHKNEINQPGEATYDLPPVSKGKNPGALATDYDILKAASNDIFGKSK